MGLGRVGSQEDMEWSGPILLFHCASINSGFSVEGEVSVQARWHLSVDCPRGMPDKGIMEAFPLALALAPNNSVFSYVFLVTPELLIHHWSPGRVYESK